MSKRLKVVRRVTNGEGGAELGRRVSGRRYDPHNGVALAFDGTDPVRDVHGTNTGGVGDRRNVLVRDDGDNVALAYGERAADPVGLHANIAAVDVFALDRSIVLVFRARTNAECSAGTVRVSSAFIDNELIRSTSMTLLAHPVGDSGPVMHFPVVSSTNADGSALTVRVFSGRYSHVGQMRARHDVCTYTVGVVGRWGSLELDVRLALRDNRTCPVGAAGRRRALELEATASKVVSAHAIGVRGDLLQGELGCGTAHV